METKDLTGFTLERSVHAAIPLRVMSEQCLLLDVEYLTDALKALKEQHNFRDSAAILSPSPLTHNDRQELDAAKIKQLELFLELAGQLKEIIRLQNNLSKVTENEAMLKSMFGL